MDIRDVLASSWKMMPRGLGRVIRMILLVLWILENVYVLYCLVGGVAEEEEEEGWEGGEEETGPTRSLNFSSFVSFSTGQGVNPMALNAKLPL